MFLVACGSTSDGRVDAFGWAEKHRLDLAASSVTRCSQIDEDEERFLCADLLGGIRLRQGMLSESAMAYREAFAIRDRIAKKEGYGPPNADSLHQWGWALLRTGHDDEARSVLERARIAAASPDEQLILAAVDLELAELEPSRATSLRAEAASHACAVDGLVFFGKTHELHKRFFPADVWTAVATACLSPNEAAQIRTRAAMLAKP